MAYLLPHLHYGWEVDQAIVTEEDRVVIIRFGRDSDPTCMVQDEILMNIAEKVKNFAVIYVVDLDEVTDFSGMYELYDPCTTMFFYRNKHIMVDLGTGDNNKINWALADKQEFIDIIEVVYRGARKGREAGNILSRRKGGFSRKLASLEAWLEVFRLERPKGVVWVLPGPTLFSVFRGHFQDSFLKGFWEVWGPEMAPKWLHNWSNN